jgi:hypothetical protein
MEKGFDVFDSCQTNGPVDLVAFDSKKIKIALYDVKSENFRLTGPKKGSRISRPRRDKKLSKLINMIYIDKDGSVREGKRKNAKA